MLSRRCSTARATFRSRKFAEFCSVAGWPNAAPLTALVVEFHTQPEIEDPLGTHLGHARMLRVSPLVPIPDAC